MSAHRRIAAVVAAGMAVFLPQSDAQEGGLSVRASAEVSGYADDDAVSVLTPTVSGTIANPARGWSATGRYLVDAVSAASVDIVSSASAKWFEVRQVGSGAFDYKRGRYALSLSGGVSSEPDYLSLGAGGTLSVDLFDKNVTPVAGIILWPRRRRAHRAAKGVLELVAALWATARTDVRDQPLHDFLDCRRRNF